MLSSDWHHMAGDSSCLAESTISDLDGLHLETNVSFKTRAFDY